MVTKLDNVKEEVKEDNIEVPKSLGEQPMSLNEQKSFTIDPKTEITITIEELQALIQAERLAILATSITNKINTQLK